MSHPTNPAKRIAPEAPLVATALPAVRKRSSTQGTKPFPIIGIGASAGGLEALTRFFDHVAAGERAAYIVIQHQDPDHPSILPELLQRHTTMPVSTARNRTHANAGHVYVIPANKDLSILHGVLYLLEPVLKRGLRLPIDYFFRALAADCQERAVAVILSGMGSDGTLGLRAIKEKAGLTLVQAPETAAFAGMPQSAIAAGLADIVAPADELPVRIAAYLQNAAHGLADHAALLGSKPQSALETIVILLRERTGNDFSLYKKNTLYRRIEHRMALHQIASIADYATFLRSNDIELDSLFDDFLIGVTRFFRDPPAWDALIDDVLPALLATQPPGRTVRAWVPACSTGEEAYSLAIAFREAKTRLDPPAHYALQIFATDLDQAAIEQARAGFYPANIAADVSPERLEAWFIEENKGYRVKPEIRDTVIFAPQNLIMDPPFTRLDILCCRNLLIYLSQDLQDMLLPLFHYALNYHGILMLGTAESIGRFTQLFSVENAQQRIYRRIERSLPAIDVEFPIRPRFASAVAQASMRATHYDDPRPAVVLAHADEDKWREAEQASQEELRSANEELQSTNEELTTSKEEMQSLNEELQTINVELQAKVSEMSSVSSDMENLLNSTEISTIFLDTGFNIRRFTPNASDLFKLLPVDVGRPLSHIVSDLDYQDLIDDAGDVLRTLIPTEKTVRTRDGRHIRVRIMPYRSLEHVIEGVVITFTDISESHAWRSTVEEARHLLESGLKALSGRPCQDEPLEQLLRKVQHLLRIRSPSAHISADKPDPRKGAHDQTKT